MARKPLLPLLLVTGAFLASNLVNAAQYGGIEFPGGVSSFADKVVSFDPSFSGGNIPTPAFSDSLTALGAPDFVGSAPSLGFVSLGSGGQLVLEFTNNYLTGSDSSAFDLHIFEIGPDVEDTLVEISKNGTQWFDIGYVFGATSSIDIDAFGFTSQDMFSFVRLTDDPTEGQTIGNTVGADIDAVGAITTIRRHDVPDAGSSALMVMIGLLALTSIRRKLSPATA